MNGHFRERLIEARRLLLADDDPTYCQVLAEALRRHRFAVRIAHSVPEALAIAKKTALSFAVIDLVMPGGSGLEVVAGLCARDPRVKVVVLTGYASIATAVEECTAAACSASSPARRGTDPCDSGLLGTLRLLERNRITQPASRLFACG